MVMNALFDSQFNYYPAILVCHICSLNNQTDSKNAVDEFNTTITIQTLKNTKRKTILSACTWEKLKHLQLKVSNNISPEIMNEIVQPGEEFH